MPLLSHQKRAKTFFDYLSRFYDHINPRIYTKEMKELLLNEIEGKNILDVGVGTGYTTKEIPNSIGIDLSYEMIKKGKKNYTGSLIVGDALKPPFKPKSFDTIISAGSFYYFPSPLEALRKFHELLRDRGVFLCIVPNTRILSPFIHTFKEKDLEDLYKKSSFRQEKLLKVCFGGIAYFSKARKM